MSGDCPECDRPLLWGGMGGVEHTDAQHALYRHTLTKAVTLQLRYLRGLWQWQQETAFRRCVGIRWRNGVYPGWRTESRSEIPYEAWDTLDWDYLLRMMREGLAALFEDRHGVKINQATWFHKIYDGRTQT